MTYNMKLKNDPFNRIKSGKKTIEIRLYDDKRKQLKENDYIEFTNLDTKEIIKVKIIKLHLFKTFKELFETFDNNYLGHPKDYKIDYKKMYDYYTKEEENKYGVVGIEIKLIKE